MQAADLAAVADSLRVVLAEAADPASESVVTAGTRNRIEGAAAALDSAADVSENGR